MRVAGNARVRDSKEHIISVVWVSVPELCMVLGSTIGIVSSKVNLDSVILVKLVLYERQVGSR